MLNIPIHIWLPVFFGLEQMITFRSGLLRFSFFELSKAVETRYLSERTDRARAVRRLCSFFDQQRQSLPLWPKPPRSLSRRTAFELPWLQLEIKDNCGLTTTLADLNILNTLMEVDSYSLLELWQGTGWTFQRVADRYLASFEQAVEKLVKEGTVKTSQDGPAVLQLLFHLENIYRFLDLTSCNEGLLNVSDRIVNILESVTGQCEESRRVRLLNEYRYHFACALCEARRYSDAENLHMELARYWRQALTDGVTDRSRAECCLAASLNGLALVLYHQHRYQEAEPLFIESERLHKSQGDLKGQADCLVNLGLVLMGMDCHSLAVDNFRSAVQLYEDVHYDSVPHIIGNVYNNLGLAYRRMNRLDEAEQHYRQSLEIKANAVGWEHPSVGTAYMNLGAVEIVRKHWLSVETLTLEALRIFKANAGSDETSAELRQCQENLVLSLLKQDKFQAAETHYWNVFEALRRHDLMSECLPWVHHTMAKYYLDCGQFERANRILTSLVHSSARTALTFLYLDQLDMKRGDKTPRKAEETLDYGIKLFAKSQQLLKQKVMLHHIARDDVDGAMTFWASVSAGPGDYASLVEWCQEAGKTHAAVEIQTRALQLFQL